MLIPNGFAQANFVWTGTGVPSGAEMTLGFDITGAGDVQDTADNIRDIWNANDMDEWYGDEFTMEQVEVKYGPNNVGPSAIAVANAVGTGSFSCVSPNVTILVKKQTAAGGKAGRGRMFQPGAAESAVSEGGALQDTWIEGIGDIWNAMAIDWGAADLVPVVLHGADSPISTPTPITTFVVDGRVATQRRRLRR